MGWLDSAVLSYDFLLLGSDMWRRACGAVVVGVVAGRVVATAGHGHGHGHGARTTRLVRYDSHPG